MVSGLTQETALTGLRSPFITHKSLPRILAAVAQCAFMLFELPASAVSLLVRFLVRSGAEDLGEEGSAIVRSRLCEDGLEVVLHR